MDFRNLEAELQERRRQLELKYGPDFDKPAPNLQFELTNAEKQVVDAWLETLKPEIITLQRLARPSLARELGLTDEEMANEIYYGAVGGGITYSFLPTSLGNIITVRETITGRTLNVSEALDWFFYG